MIAQPRRVVVYKFNLKSVGRTRVEMPDNAQILSVQNQFDVVTLLALCNPENPQVKTRIFESVMTGEECSIERHPDGRLPAESSKYLGTVQLRNGEFVAHVFEVTP